MAVKEKKKPFGVRVEESIINRFKAMVSVHNIDNAVLFEKLVFDGYKALNKEQKAATDALMSLWKTHINTDDVE